jgi:hypothetical protein
MKGTCWVWKKKYCKDTTSSWKQYYVRTDTFYLGTATEGAKKKFARRVPFVIAPYLGNKCSRLPLFVNIYMLNMLNNIICVSFTCHSSISVKLTFLSNLQQQKNCIAFPLIIRLASVHTT